jgi:hypothetical protein
MAIRIVENAAHELVSAMQAIYSKLETFPVPLVITGKTILHGKQLKQEFHRECEVQGLIFTTVHDVEEPAEIALQLARQMTSGDFQSAS